MSTETTIDTGTSELLCVIRDRVALITLNRPEARNSLSDALTPALRTMIRSCGENPDVGALLITGAGEAFCAGGNVKGMGAHRDPKKLEMSFDDKVADLQERQRLLTGALVSVRKPTIAALPGPAVGAGLAIAMACDIRIAAQSAFVATGYARIALSGDYGIAWLLTRLVGTARARELLFTGDRVDAVRCEAIGLVNRVVPDDKLQAEAFALAKSLAEGPRLALPLHEGQSRRGPAVRLRDRARPRGRTSGSPDHDRRSQGSGAGLHRETQGGVHGEVAAQKCPALVFARPGSSGVRPRLRGYRPDGKERRGASSRRECLSVRRRSPCRSALASSRPDG
ncbi:enoyl-CoA hydratase/carnithine racemase [Bradyrhizobium sp. GM5.1]